MKHLNKYTVIRDTREKQGAGWTFAPSERCFGTVSQKLDIGDYTLKGFEKLFTIERKGSVVEFCKNLLEARFVGPYDPNKKFERQSEFVRLETVHWPFILLEFTVDDMLRYPYIDEIPKSLQRRIRYKGQAAFKKTIELQMMYKTKIIFCGDRGKDVASSIFKRVVEEIEKNAQRS